MCAWIWRTSDTVLHLSNDNNNVVVGGVGVGFVPTGTGTETQLELMMNKKHFLPPQFQLSRFALKQCKWACAGPLTLTLFSRPTSTNVLFPDQKKNIRPFYFWPS